ncbi:hypothetical protein L596_029897 [Steinernema carpocapsae]|uniref:Band 7 domain-containing protein n=1 Tax=Steinernema carpocapsae TaxID=34508 RepID=A0A4V5ZX57_STECR|nr:hypothetical protein L596_029897 [Steinernema carpocapsae]
MSERQSPKQSFSHLTHTPLSMMPLSQRRERLMKRTHTLTSEVWTPSGSVEDSPRMSRSSSSHESSVTRGGDPSRGIDKSRLTAPTAIDVGLEKMERPPHRRGTLENIQMRTRSQSWLIRSRHLFDDSKQRQTPIIDGCLFFLSVLLLLFCPLTILFCLKVAKEYERAVVFRLGRLTRKGTKGPGMFFIMPCIDTYKMVDLRVLSFDVPPQEILSRDSVTVTVEAVIYFKIANPVISVTNVNDAQFSTRLLAQTTLRNVLGTKTLSEVLVERDIIANVIEKVLDEGTDPWGVKVQRVEIKDIRLPTSSCVPWLLKPKPPETLGQESLQLRVNVLLASL